MIKQAIRAASAFATIAMTGTMILASQSALGAECKGMEKAACERQDSCTWVDSYKRKDDVVVNGYCRGKGGKKSSKSTDSSGSSSN
jgi:hypothetical protein